MDSAAAALLAEGMGTLQAPGLCGTAGAAAAAAAVLQVLKADLVGAIAAPLQSALDVRGVAVEQHRAHGHGAGQLVRQGALAVCVACDHLVGLFAHHVFCLSPSPDIHSLGEHL